MRSSDIITTDTIAVTPSEGMVNEARPFRILVPVNSSQAAFNSLEYALNLARVRNASLHLVHLTDMDELTESENPVVVRRILDRLERKAENCIESLREIIEESGVTVLSSECFLGNVDVLLRRQIESLIPNLIVIGRHCFRNLSISSVIKWSSNPVIVVPQVCPLRPPATIVFSSNRLEPGIKSLDPLLEIIPHDSDKVINLTILTRKRVNENKVKRDISSLKREVQTSFLVDANANKRHGTSANGQLDTADLLCYVHRRRSLLDLLFRRKGLDWKSTLSLPILVLKGGG
jgi:nucleotide-binding universal stress UspA family protein